MRRLRGSLFLGLIAVIGISSAAAQSVYTMRPEDAHAVDLTRQDFGARGDGEADDSDALQRAINRAQETVHHGIVLVPEGRYRLTRTIHVWAGIRLIGYGAHRPVFVLAAKTPGFQEGAARELLWFTDERTPEGEPIADASEFTFFSAVSNIDFEIGEGNAAAVAVRFNVAQHSFVAHAEFRLGSARAAMEHVGNQAFDIHVHGGQYGIVTGKTSPAWQFLLMDSSFEGQKVAAISTHEAGMTLVRDGFTDVPVAVEIPPGEVEQLYGRDLQMRDVDTVLRLGDTENLRNEVTLEDVRCEKVAHFARGAETGAGLGAPGTGAAEVARVAGNFVEQRFTLGLEIGPDGRERGAALRHHETRWGGPAPPEPMSDIPRLPPMRSWVNVRDLGAKGDGGNDDTAVLQRAIDAHPVLYFPSGFYRLSGTLRLKANTVLIGLSPFTTQFVLADGDPHFQGEGAAVPLAMAPRGGTNIVTGIGIATGNGNPRAAGVVWSAGAGSMLEDVSFWRGRSEYVKALEPMTPAPSPPAQRPAMQLDAQYPSLWVKDGGGGVLRGIWSHGGTAKAGLLIENSATPGAIYQFSCEHHMRNEVRIDHAAHWRIYDLQTEEEVPEGQDAVAVTLDGVKDVMFANTYMYRVSRTVLPKLHAVEARASEARFDNVKVFSQTRLAFDDSVFDEGNGVEVRAHHFVSFALGPELKRGAPLPEPAAFAAGAHLERVATGFSNASGLTADEDGTVYFTDAAQNAVYRLDPSEGKAVMLARVPQSPMALAWVASGILMSLNRDTSASTIATKTDTVTALESAAGPLRSGTTLVLPVGLHSTVEKLTLLLEHKGYRYRVGSNTALRSGLEDMPELYFYAGDVALPAMPVPMFRPVHESSQLARFAAGETRLIASEDDGKTWRGMLGADGRVTVRLFAERGGTSVVEDTAGNLYIAGDQVYVYDHDGKLKGILEVPERPGSLCFGGKDRKTLFTGARGSVYAVRVTAAGK